jgi:hypothetical protein
MASSVLAGERPFGPIAPAKQSSGTRRTWLVGLVLGALFVGLLGYLVGNQVQVDTQFDQAHATVDTTRHDFAVVLSSLATVRLDLLGINGQVGDENTALAKDTAQLKVMQAALMQAQTAESQQGSAISDLRTCLGGVEQALNALSVGDQNESLDQLDAVSTPCLNAAASSG